MNPTLQRHDDAAAELDRSAFNAAFHELGLRWFWDSDTCRALAAEPDERRRIRGYLEAEQAHMLRAYDADFLTDAILAAKQRHLSALTHCPPHALPRFNWAEVRAGDVGF